MAILSFEEAMAPAAPAQKSTTAVPARQAGNRILSFEEAMGAPPVDDLEAAVKRDQSAWGVIKQAGKDVGTHLEGNTLAWGDMILGGPAMFASFLAHVTGGRAAEQQAKREGKTLTSAERAAAGKAASERIPETFFTPLKKLAESEGPELVSAYENSALGRIMHAIGEGIQGGTEAISKKTGLQQADVEAGVNALMGWMGVKGIKAIGKSTIADVKKLAATIKEAPTVPVERLVTPQGPDTSVPYEIGKKVDPAARKAELDAQIAARRKADQAIASKMKEVEKYRNLAKKEKEGDPLKVQLDERANLALDEAIALKAAKEAEGKAAVKEAAEAKAADLDARIGESSYELGKEVPSNVPSSAEIHRIITTPGHLRSAEQIMGLRRAVNAGVAKGFIDKNMLKVMAGTGIAGLTAAALWKKLDEVGYMEWRDEIRKVLGQPDDRNPEQKGYPNIRQYRTPGDTQMPFPEAPGTQDQMPDGQGQPRMFTASKDLTPGLAVGLLLGGAIKAKGGMWHPEAVERLYPNEKFLTQKQIDKAITAATPADIKAYEKGILKDRNQQGSADPRLLAGIAAVGAGGLIGSALSDKSTLGGAALGALVGGILFGSRGTRQSLDNNMGNISTTLRGFDPALERRVRAVPLTIGQRSEAAAEQVRPFLEGAGKLSKIEQNILEEALLNGDAATVKALPGMRESYTAVERLLGGMEKELQALGRFGEGVVNYFPRVIKDFEGLKNALGQDARKGFDKVMLLAETEMLQKKNRGLTEIERSLVANRYLYAPEQSSSLPGYAKGRKIGEVPPELMKFYEEPGAALMRYVSGAVSDIEIARFFGRDIKVTKSGKHKFTDVDGSIGNIVERLAKEGKLDTEGAKALRDNLRAFFVEGQKSPEAWLQDIRNVTNLGLLGDLSSAATQIQDSLMVVAYHGVRPTVEAAIQNIRGAKLKPEDLGIGNKITEELSTERLSGKLLHHVLRPVFGRVDRIGKMMNISATVAEAQSLVKTPKGLEKLREKWGDYFSQDFPALVADLQAKRQSPLVRELAYGDLADRQPISMLEMPLNYAKNPNLRIAWQLKSWMIKQTDMIRREAVQKIASGDPKQMLQGAKALTTLLASYAVFGVPSDTIKDWMSFREADPFKGSNMVENVMQAFGMNRYAADRLAQGNLTEVVSGMVMPPILKVVGEPALKGKPELYARNIPFLGREIYNIGLGGNEAIEAREATQKRIEERKRKELANPLLQKRRLEAKKKATNKPSNQP